MMCITPESKTSLVALFTELREVVSESEPGAVEKIAVFDALLDGLAEGTFPDDEKVRNYVVELAEATDRENEYERVVDEHRVLQELVDALKKPT